VPFEKPHPSWHVTYASGSGSGSGSGSSDDDDEIVHLDAVGVCTANCCLQRPFEGFVSCGDRLAWAPLPPKTYAGYAKYAGKGATDAVGISQVRCPVVELVFFVFGFCFCFRFVVRRLVADDTACQPPL
jgi:hypothetical protein